MTGVQTCALPISYDAENFFNSFSMFILHIPPALLSTMSPHIPDSISHVLTASAHTNYYRQYQHTSTAPFCPVYFSPFPTSKAIVQCYTPFMRNHGFTPLIFRRVQAALQTKKGWRCNVCYISEFNPDWNTHCRPCNPKHRKNHSQ